MLEYMESPDRPDRRSDWTLDVEELQAELRRFGEFLRSGALIVSPAPESLSVEEREDGYRSWTSRAERFDEVGDVGLAAFCRDHRDLYFVVKSEAA